MATLFQNGHRLVLNDGLSFDGNLILGATLDFDGTTVDCEAFYYAAHLAVAEEQGVVINPVDFEDTHRRIPHFFGGPTEAIMDEIWHLSPNPRMSVDEMLKADRRHFRSLVETFPIEPRPGVREFIQAIHGTVPLAIGSVTDPEDALLRLEKTGLRPFFDHLVFPGEGIRPKPHPDIFHETARRMGVNNHRNHLIFEDSPTGVRAARATEGAHVIALPVDSRPEIVQRLLDLGAHHVVAGWEELHPGLGIGNTPEGMQQGAEGDGTLRYIPMGPMALR